MESIMNRIKTYLDAKDIKVSGFEKSIGLSNGAFRKSLISGGAIGVDKLENFLTVYSDISPEWLLTGNGNMLRTAPKSSADCENPQGRDNYNSGGGDITITNGDNGKVAALIAENKLLKEQVAELKKQNSEYWNTIKERLTK